MHDSREKLSSQTIALHWIIAIGFIGTFVLGVLIDSFPRGPERAPILTWHDSVGIVVLVVAIWRTIARLSSGFPEYVGKYSNLEILGARFAHWSLLIASLLVPLTGLIEPMARGQLIPFFGLFSIPPILPTDRSLARFGEELHSLLSYLAAGIIVLHVAGALKHHIVDRDGTLRRMLGARIEVS
jgi:cytochrome b561